MAGSEAAKEALSLRSFLEELGFGDLSPTKLGIDNQAAIAILANLPTCLLAYLQTAYLPTRLLAYSPTCLLAYLPTRLPADRLLAYLLTRLLDY